MRARWMLYLTSILPRSTPLLPSPPHPRSGKRGRGEVSQGCLRPYLYCNTNQRFARYTCWRQRHTGRATGARVTCIVPEEQ